MNDAIAISKEVSGIKVITLDGELLQASGSITGGYQSKANNLIGRKDEIKELRLQLEKIEKEFDKTNKNYIEKSEHATELNNKLEIIERELTDKKIEIAIKESRIKQEEEKLVNIQNRATNIKIDIEKNEAEILSIKTEIEKLSRIKQEAETKITALENEVEEIIKANKANQNQVDIEALNEEIFDLKISINSFDESSNSVIEIVNILETEILNLKSKNEKKQAEIQNKNELQKVLELEILNLKKDLETETLKNENINQMQSEIKLKKKDLMLKEAEVCKTLESLSQKEQQLLPKKLLTEQNIYKLELNKDNLIEQIWDEYEITLNNIKLEINDDIYKENKLNQYDINNEIIGFDVNRAKKIVNILNEEIKQIGNVNLDSIAEYTEAKERYDFLTHQKEDLEKTKYSLNSVIKDISATMEEQFKERLKLINEQFKIAFSELFGGGYAKIELENKEEPLTSGIEINVEPPGKKLQSLSLLSGGERAFTAIAILFAILNVNPAPFSVLDEIEAALDDANVQRYANYLKRYSNDTQFLIITHRKGTMEIANTLYGVTMEENGISKLVSLDLKGMKNE